MSRTPPIGVLTHSVLLELSRTQKLKEADRGWAERMMEGYLALRVVLAGEARVAVEAGQVVIAPAWMVH